MINDAMVLLKFELALILFFVVLFTDLAINIKAWRRKRPVNIFHSYLSRAGLIFPCFILGLASIPFVTFLYWYLFDGIFNYIRGLNWWYGDFEVVWIQKFLKLGSLILSTIFYIILQVI